MGFFGSLKKILFEDDDEDETKSMPVYTDKNEVKEENSDKKEIFDVQPELDNQINTNDDSHFSNVKRDIGFSFEEKDVLDEVASQTETVADNTIELPAKKEEKSVFLAFDEDEFDRVNSRVNRNENRIKQDVRNNSVPNFDARRANNNFSSTTTNREGRVDSDRYKINPAPVKKTFTPSPIISPVYGILDKNYTKEDIVDKKDGLKREKNVKPIVKKEETKTIEDAETEVEVAEKTIVIEKATPLVDIDSVRKKAYGELEELEKTLTDLKLSELKEPDMELTNEVDLENIDTSVEDELESSFSVEDIELSDGTKELDKVVEEVIEDKPRTKPQLLDDLEKTSTLQILDDIEKELNSIKPITREVEEEAEEEVVLQKDETLEKDLFNLIDSMYEEGEEEEDND